MTFITNATSATSACTSASGTGCAGPTRGLATSRRRAAVLAGALLAITAAGSPPQPRPQQNAELHVTLTGLRSARGMVRLCLTGNSTRFLGCQTAGSTSLNLPAAKASQMILPNVRPGTYALLVIHDENGNGKLDMMMKIPREGFGFSNNPKLHMRPPHFEEVRFDVGPGRSVQNVRLRYIL